MRSSTTYAFAAGGDDTIQTRRSPGKARALAAPFGRKLSGSAADHDRIARAHWLRTLRDAKRAEAYRKTWANYHPLFRVPSC